MKNEKQDAGTNELIDESKKGNGEMNELPTLDQFMELVTAEQTNLAATPSGYNVYNKYHKSS